MTLPQLAEFENILQVEAATSPTPEGGTLQAKILRLNVLAARVERQGADLARALRNLRERTRSHVEKEGASVETNRLVRDAVNLLWAQASHAEERMFDSKGSAQRTAEYRSGLTDDQWRMIRRSTLRVENAQRHLVAVTRQEAELLLSWYEEYLNAGPPDPWPPGDGSD